MKTGRNFGGGLKRCGGRFMLTQAAPGGTGALRGSWPPRGDHDDTRSTKSHFLLPETIMRLKQSFFLASSSLAITLGSASLGAHPAAAQVNSGTAATTTSSVLPTVIVTAQRRDESLQKTPLPVTSFSGKTLQAKTIHSLQDLTTLDSSVRLGAATGQAIPFIRGVGNPSRNIGDEASTSIYIDDVYISRLPAAFFQLPDVAQINVLKGPQGTLYGRNSEGGLIQINTLDPSTTPTLDASAGYGNYNTTRGTIYASDGNQYIRGNVSLLEVDQGQGWGTDVATGGKNGFEDASIARTKWVVDPVYGTEFTLAADYFTTRSTDGLSSLGFEGTTQGAPLAPHAELPSLSFYDTQNNLNNVDKEYGGGVSLKVKQDVSFADLISIAAYRHTTERLVQDGDDSPENDLNVFGRDEARQVSEELRLQSKPKSLFDWVAGFYYLNQYGAYTPVTEVIAPANEVESIYGNEGDISYAGFGQATVHLPVSTNLTLGIRNTSDKVSGAGNVAVAVGTKIHENVDVFAANKNYDDTTYKAGLDHEFTDTVLGYASYSTGYKAGTFNQLPFTSAPVLPETIGAAELGVKTELFDRHLRLNADLFDEEIHDLQVQTVTTSPVLSISLLNAKAAHARGLEVDGAALITPGLSATFGATAEDAKYDSFSNAPFYAPLTVAPYGNHPETLGSADGKYLPRAPAFAANFGLDYKLLNDTGAWDVNANYEFQSAYYFDADNENTQGAYGLLDANLTYQPAWTSHWSLSLWGKNLTDVHYYLSDNENGNYEGVPTVVAPPLTFGFTLNYKL
jgi:iron complex outermembrane receptor protein